MYGRYVHVHNVIAMCLIFAELFQLVPESFHILTAYHRLYFQTISLEKVKKQKSSLCCCQIETQRPSVLHSTCLC